MNFENLPGQMLALFMGWSFTVFVQNRANRRAEALKRKDKIVDKLEKLSDWLESEISKKDFSSIQVETTYAGMISQIEVRLAQLNQHIGRPVFDIEMLSTLREIEIHKDPASNSHTPYEVREIATDIVESIESGCNTEYFAKRGFVAGLNDYFVSFRGAVALVVMILLIMAAYQFYYKYIRVPLGTCVYGAQCMQGPINRTLLPQAKLGFLSRQDAS